MTAEATHIPFRARVDALIKEARERARRRRITVGVVALAAVVAAAAYVESGGSTSARSVPLAACTMNDFRLSIGGLPSTQLMVGGVTITDASSSACRFDQTIEVAVLDRTGKLVDAPGNPAHWRMTGELTESRPLVARWTWGEWCGAKAVTFTARVAGGPLASSSGNPGPGRCDSTSGPELLRLRQ